jgi:hypothetical protein
VVGAPEKATAAGAEAGAAYVFVRSGSVWTQQSELVASDGAPYDSFGTAVAVSGDTAFVGVPYDDTIAGTNVGSVYVYVRSGTLWSEQAHLFAADASANSFFGYSVSLDGDTAVVGAIGSPGGVYVFVRSGTIWTSRPRPCQARRERWASRWR